jgi:hypothetical protein
MLVRSRFLIYGKTHETSSEDDLASTLVAMDTFIRQRPSDKHIARAKQLGSTRHPRSVK